MAGPGIAVTVRATDDEHRFRCGREDDGDGRPVEARLVGYDGEGGAEPPGEEGIEGQWACERQPPPQQPPVAGAGAAADADWLVPAAAGLAVSDISRSTLPLPQLQVTEPAPRTRRSKRPPQLAH